MPEEVNRENIDNRLDRDPEQEMPDPQQVDRDIQQAEKDFGNKGNVQDDRDRKVA